MLSEKLTIGVLAVLSNGKREFHKLQKQDVWDHKQDVWDWAQRF